MRKVVSLLAVLGLGWLISNQWPDISRYLKIKQMSLAEGHPQNVPAGGSQSYPGRGAGVPEGTGDFDSANRGGPAA